MPDGSPPTRDAAPPEGRAEAILAQARAAFVEKGFAGASMQDIARKAGMSAGNVYRYFPSKDALVEALIERDLREIDAGMALIAASPEPLQTLKLALAERIESKCEGDDTLWAEIAATAIRRPEVAAILRRMEERITQRLATVIGIVAGVPAPEAERRFLAPAQVIFVIIHGAMSRLGGAERDPSLTHMLIRAIEGVIADALAAPKVPE